MNIRYWKPILLVDDDVDDAAMVERALKYLKVTNPLVHTTDGEKALDYLRSEINEKPYLILLDLNMPRMNGIEFLKITKADNSLKTIPIVILTVSENEQDIFKCFELGVAGYVVKPINEQNLLEAIRTIDAYWTLNELPHRF